MAKISGIDEMLNDMRIMAQTLKGESDRGMALIGAAYVDELLRTMFGQILTKGKTSAALLGRDGPLGSYEARVKLAYGMGFLSKSQRKDLDLIAEVRNKFAHRYQECSFSTPEIVELCGKFSYIVGPDDLPDVKPAVAASACYLVAAFALSGHLILCANATKEAEIDNPLTVNRERWERREAFVPSYRGVAIDCIKRAGTLVDEW